MSVEHSTFCGCSHFALLLQAGTLQWLAVFFESAYFWPYTLSWWKEASLHNDAIGMLGPHLSHRVLDDNKRARYGTIVLRRGARMEEWNK